MSRQQRYVVGRGTTSLGEIFLNQTFLLRAAELAAVCGAILAGAQPTSEGWWNVMLVAVFAWCVVWVGAHSDPRAWAFAAVLGTLFAGLSAWAVLGPLAIILSGAELRSTGGSRVVGAAILATSVQVLLRLPAVGWFGTQSVVAFVALAPAVFSGYRRLPALHLRWCRRAVGLCAAFGCFALVTTVLTAVSAWRQVSEIQSLADETQAAFADVELEGLSQRAEQINQRVQDLDTTLTGPLSQPGRLLPVASQHLTALRVVAGAGARVSDESAALLSRLSADPLHSEGRINVQNLTAVSGDLGRVNRELANTVRAVDSARSGWLMAPVERRLDAGLVDLVNGRDLAGRAEIWTSAGATILGADGPTRWFVIFGTPAESRELGGLMTAWAVIQADDGVISMVATGNEGEINAIVESGDRSLTRPELYGDWYPAYQVEQYPQNITGSPELAIVASAVDDLLGDLGGQPLDGVVYADPEALEAIVALVGPIRLPSSDIELTGESTASFLLRDQYRLFPDRDVRKQVLIETLTGAFNQLTVDEVDLGQARSLLGRVVDERRLQMFAFDDELTAALRVANLYQPWPTNTGDDFISVLHTNGAPSKLDAWLEKSVNYRVQFNPSTGDREAVIEVRLTSTVDESTPGPVLGKVLDDRQPTANRVLLSVMSSGNIGEATVDGVPLDLRSTWMELGFMRSMVSVDVEAGSSVVVSWPVVGKIRQGDYRLVVGSQPSATEVEFELELDVESPWMISDLGPGRRDVVGFALSEHTAILRAVDQVRN